MHYTRNATPPRWISKLAPDPARHVPLPSSSSILLAARIYGLMAQLNLAIPRAPAVLLPWRGIILRSPLGVPLQRDRAGQEFADQELDYRHRACERPLRRWGLRCPGLGQAFNRREHCSIAITALPAVDDRIPHA